MCSVGFEVVGKDVIGYYIELEGCDYDEIVEDKECCGV